MAYLAAGSYRQLRGTVVERRSLAGRTFSVLRSTYS